jgi:hypothetical protein
MQITIKSVKSVKIMLLILKDFFFKGIIFNIVFTHNMLFDSDGAGGAAVVYQKVNDLF